MIADIERFWYFDYFISIKYLLSKVGLTRMELNDTTFEGITAVGLNCPIAYVFCPIIVQNRHDKLPKLIISSMRAKYMQISGLCDLLLNETTNFLEEYLTGEL